MKRQAMATTVESEKVKVLNWWASPFGTRVLIALEEKGVQYKYQEEDLSNKSQFLLQINPIYKKVPVLIHNGKPVFESLIIVQYIDEAWTHKPLLPSHPYARAQARFWAEFVDKKIYESGARILKSKGEALEEAKRDLVGNLEVLEGALRDMSGGKGPYFGAEEFGFVDIALIPFVSWFDGYESIGNFKIPLDTQFPLLKTWKHKCMERESVKKVLPTPDKISELAGHLRKIFVTD